LNKSKKTTLPEDSKQSGFFNVSHAKERRKAEPVENENESKSIHSKEIKNKLPGSFIIML